MGWAIGFRSCEMLLQQMVHTGFWLMGELRNEVENTRLKKKKAVRWKSLFEGKECIGETE